AIAELDQDTPPELIAQFLTSFADECTFLGETLELAWLIEAVAPIETAIAETPPAELLSFIQDLIANIRSQRDRFLRGENPSTSVITPKNEVISKVVPSQKAALSQLRIPLHKLEGMTNNIEELILTQARLIRQQKLLNSANRRLRMLTRQFEPIRDQVQNLYDQLAVGSTNISSSQLNTNLIISTTNSADTGFDALELDHYTELHTSLQSFQELMLQVQETRSDLELIDRELAEDLEQTQKNLDTLYTNVTESRLVPFRFLANRFLPQIRNLNQRFDKSVNLEIIGENTPIDQVLLEQLQTPLTHLLNNAFDHGIESQAERLAQQKSKTATIFLKAILENNQLVIVIQDDGSGINLEKVYQRALEKGICPADKSIDDFHPDEIIDWIFHPGFSTAAQVSDISGRGMGLDIVRSQIRKLRGKLQVQTQLTQGTTFNIKLPLNLSLMSLLLIQLQNRIIAIPNNSVIETIPYSELQFTDDNQQSIKWQKQTLPIVSISNLLPCPRQPLATDRGRVGIILETGLGLVAVLVDSLIREEKLIVKPFDDTVPVPTYLSGCTVLGAGEVIPVILPSGFEQSATDVISSTPTKLTVSSNISTILIAEDSVATRRMLAKVLSAGGYQTIVCRDGQEALDKIKQHPGRIDLILSDIEMPKVNGFELLQQVRANPTLKNIPVVMATSRTGDRHKQEAIKLGATDYLGKPVQPQELLTTVATLLARS
ncbi:MAG: response regulator, partial [Pleurocapsa sp.]